MQNFKPQSTYCSHISDKFCRLSDDFKISENIQNTDDWQSSVIKKSRNQSNGFREIACGKRIKNYRKQKENNKVFRWK